MNRPAPSPERAAAGAAAQTATHTAEGAAPPRRRGVAVVLLALAIAWCLARAPLLVLDPLLAADSPTSLRGTVEQATAACTLSRDELVARAVGVPPEIEAMLGDRLGEGGRLVLFLPYDNPTMIALLRLQYERLKNLLYPRPRDVSFTKTAAELGARIEPRFAGRLIVVDGTQEDLPLPVAGSFDLLAEQPLGGGARVRYWLLRKAGR